jgi:hypothetical protein
METVDLLMLDLNLALEGGQADEASLRRRMLRLARRKKASRGRRCRKKRRKERERRESLLFLPLP